MILVSDHLSCSRPVLEECAIPVISVTEAISGGETQFLQDKSSCQAGPPVRSGEIHTTIPESQVHGLRRLDGCLDIAANNTDYIFPCNSNNRRRLSRDDAPGGSSRLELVYVEKRSFSKTIPVVRNEESHLHLHRNTMIID